MKPITIIAGAAAAAIPLVILLACDAAASPREALVGGPCDGCEYVFEGMPKQPTSTARIAAAREPGEPLVIDGVVTTPAGKPAPGVIVYAHQTNAGGLYPPSTTRHGAIRGWAITNKDGAYRFETIRPGAYPKTDIPQHVHMIVVEVGKCVYYIDDLVFTDDPRLTPKQRAAHDHGRGGSGIATPARDQGGTWRARRDIALGAKIADHARCK